MELALVMVCLANQSWDAALDAAAGFGFAQVEPCSGGYLPKSHYDPQALSQDDVLRARFREALESRGLAIAALACCGNPIHPNARLAKADHDDFVATCELAHQLGVQRVSVLSGCPGGSPEDRSVNWVVPSVFDNPVQDVQDVYRWQWEEVVIPYWRGAAALAERYNVTLCVEPIASNVVYNPETFERLRDAVGERIGALVDPSHLFWQGIDIIGWVGRLGTAVAYAHVKDASVDRTQVSLNGLASAARYDDWLARPWIPRAPGYGHDELFWREYLVALRRAGYDGPVGLELEEPFLSVRDAIAQSVALLAPIMPNDPAPTGNWFDLYTGS